MYTNQPKTIFEAIRSERHDYLYNDITIVDGYTFNQNRTIKKIHKYYNSKYDNSDYEVVNGVKRKKVFFNTSKWRCDVSTKMLDIDTKDFVLISENSIEDWKVMILEKELKVWLKRSSLGRILNEVARKAPIYGSVVLKKIKGGAEIVDLRHMFNDQASETLLKGRYTNLLYYYTPRDLRKMKGIWDNIDQAMDFCGQMFKGYQDDGQPAANASSADNPYIEIYERYGEVPKSWITNKEEDDNEYVLSKFICAGVDSTVYSDNGAIISEEGVILYKEEIKEADFPLKEFHYNKTEGRWLGIGNVEETFEDQRRINQVKDQEAKSLELSALLLFQTRDNTIGGKNALADVNNGDIIKVSSEITRVDNSNRAVGEFNNVSNAYEQHADRMTATYDVIRGESTPASATATAISTQVQQVTSTHDFRRENFGIFLNEFITQLVFPEIEREINKQHLFKYVGTFEEVEKLRNAIIDGHLRQQIFETGNIPTTEEYQIMKAKMLSDFRKIGNKIMLDVIKDFFQDVDYYVTLEITGESRNVQQRLTNLSVVISQLANNPALLQNPVLKRLLFKQMSLMGMSLSELELLAQEAEQLTETQQQQQALLASQ